MKKKILVSSIFSMLAIGAIFVSCKKEQPAAATSPKMQTMSLVINGFNYDQFGISHNNYLAFIGEHPDLPNQNAAARFNYGKTYTDSYFGAGLTMSWEQFQTNLNFTKTIIDDIEDGVNPSIKMALNDKMTTGLKDFTDKFAIISRQAIETGSLMTKQNFNAKIDALQTEMLALYTPEYDITTGRGNEGAAILAMCSVAKHSYQFWSDLNIAGTGWPDDGSGMVTMGLGRSIRKARADVAAYLSCIDYCNGEDIWGGICWDGEYASAVAGAASDGTN